MGSHYVRHISTTVSGTSPSTKMYADNDMNRKLHRVGKLVGSHIQHKDGSFSFEPLNTIKGVYVNNEENRKLNRVGKQISMYIAHADGSLTITRDESSSAPTLQGRYADNAYNHRLERVGKLISPRIRTKKESPLEKKLLREQSLKDFTEILCKLDFNDRDYPVVVKAQDKLQRTEVEESWKKSGINPSTHYNKADQITKEFIPLAEISVLKKIGEGGFGKVYAALWKDNPVAFKKLAHQQIGKEKKDQLVKEIHIFSKLCHDNIVKMFGVVIDVENIGIVMEYLPKTLYHAIFIEEVQFSCEEKKKIIGEIISALCYLHTSQETPKREIAHCDVKSQNILLDVNNVAKLCDFGLSAIKNTSSSCSLAAPGQGTPRYAAPEVLCEEVLTLSGLMMSDIYSLSLVVYEILVEEEPYENFNRFQLVENVGRGSTRPSLEGTSLTAAVKELLEKGWDHIPRRRPGVARFSSNFSVIEELILGQ